MYLKIENDYDEEIIKIYHYIEDEKRRISPL